MWHNATSQPQQKHGALQWNMSLPFLSTLKTTSYLLHADSLLSDGTPHGVCWHSGSTLLLYPTIDLSRHIVLQYNQYERYETYCKETAQQPYL